MSDLVMVDGIPVERLSEICRAEQEGRLVILPVGLTKDQYIHIGCSTIENLEPVYRRAAEQAIKTEKTALGTAIPKGGKGK